MLYRAQLLRSLPRQVRSYSVATAKSGAQGNEWLAARQAQKEHAGGSADLWRKISFFIGLPACVVAYVNAKNIEHEHEAHVAHEIEANGGVAPERIVYPYMNKRDKDFPWGQYTLFYNKDANIPVGEPEE